MLVLLFLLSAAFPSVAGWEKRCFADGDCHVSIDGKAAGEDMTVAVVRYGDGISEDAVSIVLPLLGASDMQLRYVIPGVIDYPFTVNKCYVTVCSFVASIGASGVADLKRASTLQLIVLYTTGRAETFDVSLAGFTKAYNSKVPIETPAAPSGGTPSEPVAQVQPEEPVEQPQAAGPGIVTIVTPLWVKKCDTETGECLVGSKLETDSGTGSLSVSVAAGSTDPNVRVVLPHLVNVDMVHWVIPGVIDTGYNPAAECFFSMSRCEFMAALGPTGIAEMKRGEAVILHWTDQSGIERRYQFSLKGFSTAYDGEGETVDAASIRIEKNAELEAFLTEQAEETRRRAAAGEGEALREENEQQLKELGLADGNAAPVEAPQQPSAKEQELAAALAKVQQLEAEIAADAAAAKAPTTQMWTKICPDAPCIVQAWTVDSEKRYIIVAAMPDEQKMRVSFLARSEDAETSLSWSVGDGAPTEVAANCSKRGCTVDLDLTEITSAVAAGADLKLEYLSVSGQPVIGAFPTSGFIAALVSAPVKGGDEAAYVTNMLAEIKPFAALPAASAE